MQTDLPEDQPGSAPAASRRIRAVDPVDLLSYIQHVLGYTPRNSLTAITLTGRDLGAVLRCDHGAALAADRSAVADYARRFAGYLSSDDRADGSLVFLFRDGADGEGVQDADRQLAVLLDGELAQAGLPVAEAWLVTGGRLWHVDCPEPAACTSHGADVRGTRTSALNAAFILEGSVVQSEPRTSGLPAAAARMSPELTRAMGDVLGPEAGAQWAHWCVHWLRDWERVLGGHPLPADPDARARLLAGLASVQLRDVLVAAASFTLERAVRGAEWLQALPEGVAQVLGAGPREADAVLYSSVLLAASHRSPDWERIARLRQGCAELLPEAAGTPAAAARSLVAWVEWARGRGSAAGRILLECRDEHPGYALAEVLGEVVDRGILSGWAGRRATSWSAQGRIGA
jgi:hypothetical protein